MASGQVRPGNKSNLNVIIRAAKNGDLGVLACTHKATGEQVDVLIAMTKQGDEYVATPLAMMFSENPYDILEPPT